jgi:hypothetical protein
VGLRSSRLLDLGEFDAVAIHYSVFVSLDEYLAPAFREALRRYPGLKLQFIQDDYRRVDERAAAARDLGIRVLFTLYPEADIPRVWAERLPGVTVVSTLAGYVPDNLVGHEVPALRHRAIDVGYRGREMPWSLGRAAVDKVRIGEEFQRRSPAYGLRCDIRWDEDSRLYGGAWERFLAGCRAVLGTESGATITDFDGSVERGVHAYLELHPGAGFEEVSREILALHEGNLPLLVISARMFEAAVLRTPMVLFPGRYSGILEPERHYIPLAEDFSNMDEVAARLRDHAGLSALAERTHREIVESGRYSHRVMVREFDDLVSSHLGVPAAARHFAPRYALARAERWAWPDRPISRTEAGIRWVVRSAVVARFLLARPELRRLWRRWRAAQRRRGGGATTDLVADIIRLGLLGELRRARADAPIRVELRLADGPGALSVVSLPVAAFAAGRPVGIEEASRAIRRGSVRRIFWDHSSQGDTLVYRPVPGVALPFNMEARGRYQFRTLASLAVSSPEDAAEAFEATWSAPDPSTGGA